MRVQAQILLLSVLLHWQTLAQVTTWTHVVGLSYVIGGTLNAVAVLHQLETLLPYTSLGLPKRSHGRDMITLDWSRKTAGEKFLETWLFPLRYWWWSGATHHYGSGPWSICLLLAYYLYFGTSLVIPYLLLCTYWVYSPWHPGFTYKFITLHARPTPSVRCPYTHPWHAYFDDPVDVCKPQRFYLTALFHSISGKYG